ncbi:putative protein phosphatase 2C 35 [Acorus calamus]|uniref:protein-serine/threonine phosphatase n=1 Tax=Acorus calamus TaxID=4465 RepID=A0AAV9D1V5_ACOCL|nr:putative protein phosphatase 2C 35 [Acorus calamus]
MGCVYGKCCCTYKTSSDGEADPPSNGGGRRRGINRTDGRDHHVLTEDVIGTIDVPSCHLRLRYAFLTQRGFYPDSPERENQDCFCIKSHINDDPNLHFFGVFDGHGQFGAQCAQFVEKRLIEVLSGDHSLADDPVKAYNSAFLRVNSELHESEVDDSMSGTTAITAIVSGDTLFVANVGDSRAVIAVRNEGGGVIAEDLSSDQTPFRKDEYERVRMCGARVLSVDQVEGIKDPNIQHWGNEESDDEGDPPRLWVQNGMYPGTAFTRSVGDSAAEAIGVIAVPEVRVVKILPDHLFFVVASDGVFEFLSSQTVVNMVAEFSDPRDACSAIAAESYRLWLEHENRTDDITIIIVHIQDLPSSGGRAIGRISGNNFKTSPLKAEKGSAERTIFSGSEIHSPRRGSSSELQSAVDRSPARVAPSPTHRSS